mmetsp:Transcript_8836/g.20045  ORF Transcript_8836/g.20045 Transcript_8836/m.20045 type:complete len:191 (-) Transcript_8836:95-667(-)
MVGLPQILFPTNPIVVACDVAPFVFPGIHVRQIHSSAVSPTGSAVMKSTGHINRGANTPIPLDGIEGIFVSVMIENLCHDVVTKGGSLARCTGKSLECHRYHPSAMYSWGHQLNLIEERAGSLARSARSGSPTPTPHSSASLVPVVRSVSSFVVTRVETQRCFDCFRCPSPAPGDKLQTGTGVPRSCVLY